MPSAVSERLAVVEQCCLHVFGMLNQDLQSVGGALYSRKHVGKSRDLLKFSCLAMVHYAFAHGSGYVNAHKRSGLSSLQPICSFELTCANSLRGALEGRHPLPPHPLFWKLMSPSWYLQPGRAEKLAPFCRANISHFARVPTDAALLRY